jgi:murein L,D-transpeptidase YcbB/YkuD
LAAGKNPIHPVGQRPSPLTVKLLEPITIHILYRTVWVETDGRIHLGQDIYDRDAVLDAAMQKSPPGT